MSLAGLEPAEQIRLASATVLKFPLFAVEERLGLAFPLRCLAADGAYIAGGAVRDWMAAGLGRPVAAESSVAAALSAMFDDRPVEATDVDVYFRDRRAADAYRRRLLEMGARVVRERNGLADLAMKLDGAWRVVQLITFRYYASAAAVIAGFDFTVSQFAVAREGSELWLYTGSTSVADLAAGTLHVNSLSNPLGTMRRLLKYARKGFDAPDETLFAIARAVAASGPRARRDGYR